MFSVAATSAACSALRDFAGLALFHEAPDLVEPAGARDLGQVLGQQVVAGVAGRDVGKVALLAHALDVFEQDDLHGAS